MSAITTHVLDVALGRPAQGLRVTIYVQDAQGDWLELGCGTTNADGRVPDLVPTLAPIVAGVYQLVFDTAAYHKRLGVPSFYPDVSVRFRVDDESAHYHVPLLLSPFGYSTYRGA